MCVVASFLAVFVFSSPLLSIKVLLLESSSACPACVLPPGMPWLPQGLCTQRGSKAFLHPWYSPLDSCDPLISGIWDCAACSSVWGLLSAWLQLFPSLESGETKDPHPPGTDTGTILCPSSSHTASAFVPGLEKHLLSPSKELCRRLRSLQGGPRSCSSQSKGEGVDAGERLRG